jgi:thiol:disulfide interchange protein DsbD
MRQVFQNSAFKPSLIMLMALLVVPGALAPRAVADDAPKPAKRDSRPALRPKTAELSTSVVPAEAKPGDIVTYQVTAKLDPGYHIYKYSSKEGGPGPVNTSFDFFDTAGLKIEGDWSVSQEPERHHDPNFADVEFVEYHEGEVTWSIKLRVPAGTVAGKKVLRCQAGYMVCDAKHCSIPGHWTLPDAILTVVAGDAPAQPAGTSEPKAASAGSRKPSSDANSATEPTTPPKSGAGTASPDLSSSPGTRVQSEIALQAERGLIPFLIASAIGGVLALLMPCVWPMIPITVNFFVKQGQGEHGRSRSTGLAVIYCLSIIAVFTAVGVLFSFFFSASSLQNLANSAWLNLFVAALFVVFGLSLLGLFEIRLPSFLLNASAQGESRGGVIGVVFMALTLTITSFTCTFPVVGGLLVMAAGGNFLYPILGLATFATVLALPFFLLALSPSLIARMPRSGDWMNAVKVVGGLVEIGAALKFLNTAELAYVTPENAWFDAHVVLTCWIVLAAVCGLYLLGIFRTDHDHAEVKIGPGRLLFGSLFLVLALFMAPALFGRPPQSTVWNRLIVGLLPPDVSEFGAGLQVAGASGDPSAREVKATSPDPAQAERQEKKFHGVLWGMSYDQARELASAQNKPILIDFTGINCANCRAMESGVFPRPEVVALLKKFVTIQLYTDRVPIGSITFDERKKRAEINQDRLLDWAQEATNPIYVVLTPTGKLLTRIGGYNEPKVFVEFLNGALNRFSGELKQSSHSPASETHGTSVATTEKGR